MSNSLKFLLLVEGITVIFLGLDWLLGFPFWPFIFGDLIVFIAIGAYLIHKINKSLA